MLHWAARVASCAALCLVCDPHRHGIGPIGNLNLEIVTGQARKTCTTCDAASNTHTDEERIVGVNNKHTLTQRESTAEEDSCNHTR